METPKQIPSKEAGQPRSEPKKERDHLSDVMRALDESAICAITDNAGTIIYANKKFEEISKYPVLEILGKNHRILKSGHHPPEFFDDMWETISSGKVWKGDVKNVAKDGSYYWVKTVITPFLDDDGKPEQYMAIRMDISKQKHLEEQLADSLKKVEEAQKQKEEFVAMISHELKTPLTPIKLSGAILKRPKMLGELNEKQMDAVDSIIFNATRLEKIVGDLLDTQKLELGKMKFDKKEIKVNELMDMMTKNLISQTEEKGCQLINHTTEKNTIKSDSSRLAQVLTNLINNAIDFIPKDKGKIEINTQKSDDGILFSVKDNGIGMSQETQNKLFQKFFQTDTSVTRKHGGTGLGLVICKGIVEALGGKIWLESQEGKGTNFYFTIPEDGSK